jgi:hypothetical protein
MCDILFTGYILLLPIRMLWSASFRSILASQLRVAVSLSVFSLNSINFFVLCDPFAFDRCIQFSGIHNLIVLVSGTLRISWRTRGSQALGACQIQTLESIGSWVAFREVLSLQGLLMLSAKEGGFQSWHGDEEGVGEGADMAAGGVHQLAQCITCHAWNADLSS